MKRKRFTEEQIIGVLKEAEAGAKTGDLARRHGISEATIYNWKAKYGGMEVSEAKRLRSLEDENAKLKRLLADAMLDNAALKDLAGDKAQVNALVASDRVIIPVQAEYLALEGLVEFLDTIKMVRQNLNPGLELGGILVTMHDERTRLAQQVEAELRDHFSETVFRTVIPRTVRVAEAPSYGIPVTEYSPTSRGSEAYVSLADEVVARG